MWAGLLAGALVAWGLDAASTKLPQVHAQRFGDSDRSGSQRDELIPLAGTVVEGQQLIVLVDPRRETLASYHVDGRTGQIALRSVRKVRWDLELDEFNGTEPSAEKIQALLRTR